MLDTTGGTTCGISVTPIKIGTTTNSTGMIQSIIPRYKQFRAFFGSSSRMTKNAIIPPITLNKIGNKNQRLLRLFTCMMI
jgi:hypothetical protein